MHYSNQIQQTLNNFSQRGIELRVQYCNEDGKQVPRIQATGTGIMLSSDWELLRRNKPKIVRHLESAGAIDASFGEYVESKPIERTVDAVSIQSLKESAARIASSDARARESRKTAQEVQKREKEAVARERSARTGTARKPRENIWTKEQEDAVWRMFCDFAIWPIRQAKAEKNERIKFIVEQVNQLGPKRTWQTIARRVTDLKLTGNYSPRPPLPASTYVRPSRAKSAPKPKREPKPKPVKVPKVRMKKPKPAPKPRANLWTIEQENYLRVLEWPANGSMERAQILGRQITAKVAQLGPKRTWKAIKVHRLIMLKKHPLDAEEAARFEAMNPPVIRTKERLPRKVIDTARRRQKGIPERILTTETQRKMIREMEWFENRKLNTRDLQKKHEWRQSFLDELAKHGPRIKWCSVKCYYFRNLKRLREMKVA